MRRKSINITKIIAIILLSVVMNTATPVSCLCQSILNLDTTDKVLLIDDISWKWLPEQERFEYMLKFVPQINMALGVPETTFPAANVHMMSPTDPSYTKACGYTDYGTGQIYINMKKINEEAAGGWAAIYALAHEMRHLYQSKYNTIAYNPQSTIYNMSVYASDPREKDANNFAYNFTTYILNNVGVQKIGDKL